jgi:hypothetical protein
MSELDGEFVIHGVVGSLELTPDVTLEVVPKTLPAEDWIHAVLDLLVGTDRIDAAGERLAGISPYRRDLLEVLGALYAARLERPLRRDGPILMLERTSRVLEMLKGTLHVTTWSRHIEWQPHRFPVTFSQITADNDFSRGFAAVARLLAGSVRSSTTRRRLLSAARELRPGLAETVEVDPRVAGRKLPSQWRAYDPAWSIATAILSQRGLLRATGGRHGLSIAIELWPLLERLLHRSLSYVVNWAVENNRKLEWPGKVSALLLEPLVGTMGSDHRVVPDGILLEGGQTLATFEAKYKRRLESETWPPREDVFQAIATARAWNSPLAVLVYPESFESTWWRATSSSNSPSHLVAVGLGLFSYRVGAGDEERGKQLVNVLSGPPLTTMRSGLNLLSEAPA